MCHAINFWCDETLSRCEVACFRKRSRNLCFQLSVQRVPSCQSTKYVETHRFDIRRRTPSTAPCSRRQSCLDLPSANTSSHWLARDLRMKFPKVCDARRPSALAICVKVPKSVRMRDKAERRTSSRVRTESARWRESFESHGYFWICHFLEMLASYWWARISI